MTEQIISLDMYMTAGVGVVALLLGLLFTRRIPFLKRFCIPAPVSGGLMISLLLLVLHSATGMDFSFDGTVSGAHNVYIDNVTLKILDCSSAEKRVLPTGRELQAFCKAR